MPAELYAVRSGIYDEALEADGRVRPAAQAAMAALDARGPAAAREAVREALREQGVTFSSVDGDVEFPVDPVPRVITGEQWAPVEAGLAQRVRALNRFLVDAYGAREIVAAGVLEARVITTAAGFEPRMSGVAAPRGVWIGVAGLDLVREPSGRFLVLEDNVTTPSGVGYAVAVRAAVLAELGPAWPRPRALDAAGLLRGALRAASPVEDPVAAVLTDGPHNAAYWEHAWAARTLGLPLVEPGDLAVRDGHLQHGGVTLDVVYRRTDAARLDSDVGELLFEPAQAGTLGMVNAFGSAVADDKLTHAYVEDMVRFYLGEEPLLRSVPTLDLRRPEALEHALDCTEELVFKPRDGYGGTDVVIGPHAERADIESIRERVREQPDAYVAQPVVMLSHHPTVIDGQLEPRHVDLRPFVFLHGPDEAHVLPGGLTRVAFDEGALVVNSTQNGGAKDTWVMP